MANYHEKAQAYITDAKKKGMTVKAEGSELIAYPKNYKPVNKKNMFKGAKEAAGNYLAARKANKQSAANVYQLAASKARKKYNVLTGTDVTPSMVRQDRLGGKKSGDVKNYEALRDQQNTILRKKFNIS